jgi:serine/threonine-protein kinase HipA
MSKHKNFVFVNEKLVGEIFEPETGTIGFVYHPDWIKTGYPISHSLPLRSSPYAREAQVFFSNLLPEGDVRTAVASRLGISLENDYQLLLTLGGDCAGALSIGEEPRKLESRYEKVSTTSLAKRFDAGETLLAALQDENDDIRFSLAGAQDKIPVMQRSGDLFLPQGNSPSTHILKPPSRRFPHVPECEFLMSALGHALGLAVAKTTLINIGKARACLVERYDRVVKGKLILRLHQEDFCQALNYSYKAKYEREQGPTFAKIYDLLAAESAKLPEDLERLVKWLIFGVVIGNCDGHAKNLSLVRSEAGEWSLSPHYDLVSTRVYPKVSTTLAFSIGGSFDSGTVTGTHWKRLAKEIKFGSNLLKDLVSEMAGTAPAAFDGVAADFQSTYGPSPMISSVRKVIQTQVRRIEEQLKK